MLSISLYELEGVVGGAENPAPGRCGPGDGWKFLGDVYTTECLAHDLQIKQYKNQGDAAWLAHVKAAPLLPAAVGSYVRGLVFGN